MNFASYEFWKILILCYLASRVVLAALAGLEQSSGGLVSKLCLLATALILLGSESRLTLLAFLWVVLLGWLAVLLQGRKWPRHFKTVLFVVLLVAQAAPLFYYKYWNFVINEVLGWHLRIPSVIIPMGLSFYTFQTIGFWVDNLRTPQPRPTFLDYLNFSSFFPQIVAGPIEKRESLLPQIERARFRIHLPAVEAALQWIVLGLAYKLIVADNLGEFSRKFLIDPGNAWQVWFECLTFGIRIYFDFAGYSFIAIGLGLMFGVDLTLNFRCPYWSADLQEFWKTWHITLGAWLRDYIYIPLGGGRVPWRLVNILIVFLVSGIWHGAGWGFIIWGLLHGIGVAAARPMRKWIPLRPLRWALTFLYVTAAWLFFFERDAAALWSKAAALVQPSAYSAGRLAGFTTLFEGASALAVTTLILCLAAVALGLEKLGQLRSPEPYFIGRRTAASLVLVFLIVWLAPQQESSFIYFNF